VWEGRTVGQKRRLTKAITEAMQEHAEANISGLHVAIQEYPRENWARAGVLGVDRGDPDAQPPKEPTVFKLGHLMLQTEDLDRSLEFYLGFLGFEESHRDTLPDGRALLVTKQGLGITSGRPEGENPVEHIAFGARGIESYAEKAKEAGVEIADGPKPTGYGISLYLRDPDGNKVELYGDAHLAEREESG
jgi:catechol 2,3-dioxygenase-like lactoylglutathione lyase family enzyme/phenylpyruvate tautomerase PptA (4-oxalocrotonate tautomerase family)